jgi:hypothetical protein
MNWPAFIGCAGVVVDHLPSLVADLKSHWLPHVLPATSCDPRRIRARQFLDLEDNEIATARLAIDWRD